MIAEQDCLEMVRKSVAEYCRSTATIVLMFPSCRMFLNSVSLFHIVPIFFLATSVKFGFPAKAPVSDIAQEGAGDEEAEIAFIISNNEKDITQDRALKYVLGNAAMDNVNMRDSNT